LRIERNGGGQRERERERERKGNKHNDDDGDGESRGVECGRGHKWHNMVVKWGRRMTGVGYTGWHCGSLGALLGRATLAVSCGGAAAAAAAAAVLPLLLLDHPLPSARYVLSQPPLIDSRETTYLYLYAFAV